MKIIRGLVFVLCCICSTVFADTPLINAWTKPTSGNWDDPSAWSQGVLPSSSQTVLITNSGWKAVAINSSTPVNFPGSMTVSNLTIRGASDTRNLLLLNYFGTAQPLTVLNGLTLQDNAQIVNFNSGLVVQGGTIIVTNAQIIQDLGIVRTTNATMYLQNAEYDLTNGVFEAGQVVLGWPVSARFNQYGGAVSISALDFAEGAGAGGTYALYGGYLSLPGGLSLVGGNGAYSSYIQSGGTNQTTSVYLEPNMYGSSPSFTLNGGLLADSAFSIVADDFGSLTVDQNGGTHIITNTLSLSGGFTHGETIRPGTYHLNAGTLSAGAIDLNGYPGDAVLVQSNGTATVGTISAHSAGYFASCNTHITLAGGTLSCSNFTTDDGHGTLDQSGGALLVSNLLDLRGFRDLGQGYTYYFRYTFTGGTLTASNINISGDWIIGDSTGANRITNSGTCTLSHRIQIGNAVEQLGRFILGGTNATIDLAGSASRLSFPNSSGQVWAGGATLTISDWNGSLSGGGAEQLKFGTSASGLTSSQLSQILFSNPAGLTAGTYPAKILSTGEVVPDSSGTPPPGLVNNWINPSSDKWEDASSWSLGISPAANQTVNITNAGYKAVNIDNATVSGFPNSLTVSNLNVAAPMNALSTLLLNYFGLGTPLKVLNDCTIGTNGTIDNFSSNFEVDGSNGGALSIDGGTFTQQGGQTVVNTAVSVLNGSFNATNGSLTLAGGLTLGSIFEGNSSRAIQDGGSIAAQQIDIRSGGTYELVAGVLYAINGSQCNAGGSFIQAGGTNYGDIEGMGTGSYHLENGMVQGNLMSLGNASFVQDSGLLSMQTISLVGASCTVSNGIVRCGTLTLNYGSTVTQGGGEFFLTNNFDLHGEVQSEPDGPYIIPSTFVLEGGELHLPSMTLGSYGVFEQDGGSNEITGIPNMSGGTYTMSGGTVEAGQLKLSSNSTLAFRGSPALFRFGNSSAVGWTAGALLIITNWSSSDHVFAGNDASGLSASQLQQIQFANPAGFAPGNYSAQILSTGEVVPRAVQRPTLTVMRIPNALVLTWPSGFQLLSATNVAGPYTPVSGASSPWTNSFTKPMEFFRLQSL
jgi:hypothetical protein